MRRYQSTNWGWLWLPSIANLFSHLQTEDRQRGAGSGEGVWRLWRLHAWGADAAHRQGKQGPVGEEERRQDEGVQHQKRNCPHQEAAPKQLWWLCHDWSQRDKDKKEKQEKVKTFRSLQRWLWIRQLQVQSLRWSTSSVSDSNASNCNNCDCNHNTVEQLF